MAKNSFLQSSQDFISRQADRVMSPEVRNEAYQKIDQLARDQPIIFVSVKYSEQYIWVLPKYCKVINMRPSICIGSSHPQPGYTPFTDSHSRHTRHFCGSLLLLAPGLSRNNSLQSSDTSTGSDHSDYMAQLHDCAVVRTVVCQSAGWIWKRRQPSYDEARG